MCLWGVQGWDLAVLPGPRARKWKLQDQSLAQKVTKGVPGEAREPLQMARADRTGQATMRALCSSGTWILQGGKAPPASAAGF